MSALGPGCVKTLPTVVSAQQKIKFAALATFSCQNGIPIKSILRHSDAQNCFHTAWVISGHFAMRQPCLLYPQKRTFAVQKQMSALCQKRTCRALILTYSLISLQTSLFVMSSTAMRPACD